MKRKLISLALLAVAAGVMYASFDWAVGAVIHNRRVVMVPDLSGKTVTEALGLLGAAQLGLAKEGEQFDKRYPAGTIVRQNPPAGMRVREGRVIRVTLSQGGETLFAPDIVGQPLRNAQTLLQNVGLNMGEVERRPSLRYEKDQVMAMDPPTGTMVGKNAFINVVLSAGPPGADTLLLPDFTGKLLRDAQTWASEHQLAVTVREEQDATRAAGLVLSQAPTADSPVRSGDGLTLVANAGVPTGDAPHLRYEVPPGSSDRDIRVLVLDESGEREVFRQAQKPGSVIDLPIAVKGHARARVFVNGIMVEEQDLR